MEIDHERTWRLKRRAEWVASKIMFLRIVLEFFCLIAFKFIEGDGDSLTVVFVKQSWHSYR